MDASGATNTDIGPSNLTDIETELNNCNAEIQHLQSRLELLHQRRARFESQREYINHLGSASHKLPNEILLQFFDYASEMNDLTSKSLRKMPALAISAASSQFRELAKSSPRIWSRIRLSLTPRHNHPLPLLEHYLASSQQFPLTLEL
ncbi:hypothetical protein GYMLUDRAFT_159899, partial [Collybiopsis luxurians FD-317 M1]